jgi:hypothetical protein
VLQPGKPNGMYHREGSQEGFLILADLATGRRPSGGVTYPVSELARRHGAGVERETSEPDEAYAAHPPPEARRYEAAWLPDL